MLIDLIMSEDAYTIQFCPDIPFSPRPKLVYMFIEHEFDVDIICLQLMTWNVIKV